MHTEGSIYTLTDPRDGAIRYVGKTTKSLTERLAGHLASPTNPAMRLWINTLSAQRLVPVITSVSTVIEPQLDAEEQRQIKKHARAGHRLFNSPYYRQHLGDLTSVAPVVAPTRAPGRAGWPRIVRYAIWLAAASWYLWTVGFSVLVQREVLPLLPVDEAVAAWHVYFARPLMLIALHALIVACVWIAPRLWRAGKAARPAKPAPARPVDKETLVLQAAAVLDAAIRAESA